MHHPRQSIARWIPILDWIRGYNASWLRADLVAGLTVWALVVPQAVAYAQIAGLPPQAGVFASFAAPLGYALFGSSRQLIVSPTSATAAISASLVAPLLVADDPSEYAALSAALAMLCGLLFLLLGKLKLGFLSQFIAPSVQTGFLIGLGLTIMVGQVCKILGIPSSDGPFYRQFGAMVRQVGDVHSLTLVIGATSLICLFLSARYLPGIPAALILVTVSILTVSVFDLADKGVDVVGSVDRAIPLPAIPVVSIHDLLLLVPGTFAIVVIGYSESMSVARRFADEHRYEVDGNRELVALGISSLAGGLFQGFITAGGASQSAANDRAGARTQVSAIVLAIAAALSAMFLMPVFEHLPLAVLGAIVVNAVAGFVDIPALRRVYHLRRDSFMLAATALAGVLLLGILPGLLLAVAITALLLLGRIARPHAHQMHRAPGSAAFVPVSRSGAATVPASRIVIYRPDSPLLYVNATWIRGDLGTFLSSLADRPDVLTIDLEASADLDISGIDMLVAVRHDLSERGIDLWLSNASPRVIDLLTRSELEDLIAQHKVFATNSDAVQRYTSTHPQTA